LSTVGKFRLQMATQLGEKVAKDFGFTQFHIDPLLIAREKGIEVFAKPADIKGVSGVIIFVNDQVSLIYSTEHNNRGFENFSIAHELGHYFLPGHPEEIKATGGQHISRADFTQGSSIEIEADHFASGLLMPSSLVTGFLDDAQVGIEGILALAEAAHSSATAAAIRAAQCSPYPVAIIVSQRDTIAYAFFSEGFKGLDSLPFIRRGHPLPPSMTRTFNAKPDNVLRAEKICGETSLYDWFGCTKRITLDEEVLGLGAYGYTLTILSSEDLPKDIDEGSDEDAQLERSWDPKFAYNR